MYTFRRIFISLHINNKRITNKWRGSQFDKETKNVHSIEMFDDKIDEKYHRNSPLLCIIYVYRVSLSLNLWPTHTVWPQTTVLNYTEIQFLILRCEDRGKMPFHRRGGIVSKHRKAATRLRFNNYYPWSREHNNVGVYRRLALIIARASPL